MFSKISGKKSCKNERFWKEKDAVGGLRIQADEMKIKKLFEYCLQVCLWG